MDTPAPTDADTLPGLDSGEKQAVQSSPNSPQGEPRLLSSPQVGYVVVLLALQLYCEFLHGFGPLRRFEFLPLLLTSVSCAVAVVWSWTNFLTLFLLH